MKKSDTRTTIKAKTKTKVYLEGRLVEGEILAVENPGNFKDRPFRELVLITTDQFAATLARSSRTGITHSTYKIGKDSEGLYIGRFAKSIFVDGEENYVVADKKLREAGL
jgi:hypothetical protein